MTNFRDKIKSLRDSVGFEYKLPDEGRMETMIQALWSSKDGLDYLKLERGLSEETIKHFKLGYDESKHAIAIPIYKKKEDKNVLVNIKYRFIKPTENKYTSEKNAEVWIYNEDGIQNAISKGAVLIVEGEFDLMSVWQTGLRAVVSPASGKDSYGVWLELLDNIPQVYIAYDNDKPGQEASFKLAERLGIEKCFEIKYPDGFKDANEYFKKNTRQDFITLKNNAKPYYRYQFKGLGDVIHSLRFDKQDVYKVSFIPDVEIEKDWLMVVSGRTNAGKTTFTLNVADELASQGVPVLVMPFERGIDSVGKRFLMVKFDKTVQDFEMADQAEWAKIVEKCGETPVYFAVPKKEEIVDTIIKAKRLFDVKFVIVDHLDYMVRHVTGNRESEISNTLQDLKRIAEEHKIVMLIVSHVRKIDSAGAEVQRNVGIEDLKGSSSLYQDPECVILLTGDGESELEVHIGKNKGKMSTKAFAFKPSTGKLSEHSINTF